MEDLTNAGTGINKAYRGMRGALICLLLMCVPSLRIASLGVLIFMVYYMIGLYGIGKDIAGCRKAFWLSIANIVVMLLAFIPVMFISLPASIARCAIDFFIVYQVFTSVSEVTDRMGAVDVRKEGVTAWQVNAVCYGIAAVAIILEWLFYGSMIEMLCTVASMLVPLVAKVFYMVFLGKCDQALNN